MQQTAALAEASQPDPLSRLSLIPTAFKSSALLALGVALGGTMGSLCWVPVASVPSLSLPILSITSTSLLLMLMLTIACAVVLSSTSSSVRYSSLVPFSVMRDALRRVVSSSRCLRGMLRFSLALVCLVTVARGISHLAVCPARSLSKAQ